jgi:hypothetical protein
MASTIHQLERVAVDGVNINMRLPRLLDIHKQRCLSTTNFCFVVTLEQEQALADLQASPSEAL